MYSKRLHADPKIFIKLFFAIVCALAVVDFAIGAATLTDGTFRLRAIGAVRCRNGDRLIEFLD